MGWLWWAPLGAAILHIAEEFVYPGGFADWDRAYRPAIRSSITPRFHVTINGALLLACTMVALAGAAEGAPVGGGIRVRSAIPPRYAAAAWLTLAALLFSNAVFHAVGSVRTRRWSPGLWTGLLLYVPLAAYGYWRFVSGGQASWATAAIAALMGGSYHLWASLAHAARARSPARK